MTPDEIAAARRLAERQRAEGALAADTIEALCDEVERLREMWKVSNETYDEYLARTKQ